MKNIRLRKRLKKVTLILSLVVLSLLFILFKSKIYVQDLHSQLKGLQVKLMVLENEKEILEAEFSYLTSPDGIQRLVEKHLHMKKIIPSNINKICL